MKGVKMYHAIKSLRETGKSIREISSLLAVSKTTVQKYVKISSTPAYETFFIPTRKSVLSAYSKELKEKLEHNPKLRASKLQRIFQEQHPEIKISDRAFRSYIRKLKKDIDYCSYRHYRVVDYLPGMQMQVDPGEILVEDYNGENYKVYFVVFIFCYSKRKFVYYQDRPLNTNDFINAHEECFRYFGYLPKEMIYDQTKLVVIKEKYRELWFNEKFYRYITKIGVSPYVCEGYDPESKGIVENAVKEVKYDFFSGEVFYDIQQIRERSLKWLELIDQKEHSTLRATPASYFEEEKKHLSTYQYSNFEKRLVDKTGLFSYKSNKYSAPYKYQRKSVMIKVDQNILQIFDPQSMELVASHLLAVEKVRPVVNNNHFRDYSLVLEEMKEELIDLLKEYDSSKLFVDRLVSENARCSRDQLRAVRGFYNNSRDLDWNELIKDILLFEEIKASKIENLINEQRRKLKLESAKAKSNNKTIVENSIIQRDLSAYDTTVRSS